MARDDRDEEDDEVYDKQWVSNPDPKPSTLQNRYFHDPHRCNSHDFPVAVIPRPIPSYFLSLLN